MVLAGRTNTHTDETNGVTEKASDNSRCRGPITFASRHRLTSKVDPPQHRAAQSHRAWRPLVLAIAGDKELRSGLAAFANWCASQKVTPQQVSDATLQEFLTWLETRTLHKKPRELARRVPILWSRASSRIHAWPKSELTRLSFRLPSNRVSWRDLPESFRQDVEASTINGNAQRGTGILNNQMYIGRLVWNRLRYLKDPSTGKRRSKLNPPETHIVKEVPHLRIVPQDLWDAV